MASKILREIARPFKRLGRKLEQRGGAEAVTPPVASVARQVPAQPAPVPVLPVPDVEPRHVSPHQPLYHPKLKTPVVEGDKPGKVPGIEYLAETRLLGEVLPTAVDHEIRLFARHIRTHAWAMPEHELMVLGAIVGALKPTTLFEFGTYTGGSTLVMAANAPENFALTTIDIGPQEKYKVVYEPGVFYKGTPYASRIRQIIGDSLQFDIPKELRGAFDLVFVDGNHRYQWAYNDTCLAFELVRPGGVVLWHDYTWLPQHSECLGVTQTVNDIQRQRGKCFHIDGTRFAIYLP